MSETKRAAVVKRGAERDRRDLFASRPADLGSVKQTLRPAPPGDFGGVAARNETSVLFTVDALRGAARVKTPAPELAPLSSAFIGSDDEGVIDLKALASTPQHVGARSVAPLFSEPPPAAFSADVGGGRGLSASDIAMPGGFKLGKRAIAGIAAAALAVVLCSIGLAAAFKGEEPVVRATASLAAPITPAAPVVTAPAPPPAPVITAASAPTNDTSTASEDEAKTVKGKKGKKGKGKAFSGTKVQSSGVAAKSASEPLISKPTPKAPDKCGCKGDFNCILRCTAKGS